MLHRLLLLVRMLNSVVDAFAREIAGVHIGSLADQIRAQGVTVAVRITVVQRRVALIVSTVDIGSSTKYTLRNPFVAILARNGE